MTAVSLQPKGSGFVRAAIAKALADGVAEHGCSVHFVTEELDGGPVAGRK